MIPPRYRERAKHLRGVMRDLSGVDVKNPSRKRIYVVPRAMIAHVLIREGCTTLQVGALLGKNHATITHYKDLMADFLSSPGYEAERELWTKFKNAI